MKHNPALTLLCLLALAPCCAAQQDSDWVEKWLRMVSATQAEQPHWVTPLVTVTPRLEQEIRFDAVRQTLPTGHPLWNLGNGKGLELIPERHIEVLLNAPPYLVHNNRRLPDGFGDVSFVMKYRIISANEEHGGYILTVFLAGSVPTGSYRNGSDAAVVTPTLAAGKGWRRFDVQSTIGGTLPVTDQASVGHAITWNNALQYHASRFLWPEFEVNSTFFRGGPNDGKKQVFLTPGLVVGRFPLHNRVGLTIGAGIQFAVTRFHTFDHALVLTARLPF